MINALESRFTISSKINFQTHFHSMIDYLKKENFKLRSSAYLLKTDLNEMKLKNTHLAEQYRALHDSHEAVRQHSTDMSAANFKLNTKNIELKKKYHETKNSLKELIIEHKQDLKKLKDLMKAKDQDNTSEIARLEAELEATKMQVRDRHEVSQKGKIRGLTLNTSQHAQKKKNGDKRSPKNLTIVTDNKKTRAKVKGRKSTNNMQVIPSSSTHDDERWGHDGFFEIVKDDASPSNGDSNFSKKKSRNRKSRKRRTPTNGELSGTERNIVSPDAPKTSPMHRVLSSSSLKDALHKKNISVTRSAAPKSSLALAASKASSSLSEKSRKN